MPGGETPMTTSSRVAIDVGGTFTDIVELSPTTGEIRFESVAVPFLHSYANPAHEREMRDILAEVAPDVAVTLSHELSREYREYERTSTAVLDAYVKPIVRRYLEHLDNAMRDDGFTGR